MSLPVWYRIPEIPINKFIGCLRPIYTVLEGNHVSNTNEDPFIKSVLVGFHNMIDPTWQKAELARSFQKALEMKMGDFHEELMGKFPGYNTFETGHVTGCDVGKTDMSELFEVKNRDNTMNADSGKSVVAKLKKHAERGILAVLIEINCPNGKVKRFGADPMIQVWNGQQAYTHFSGRESFITDLNITLKHVFAHYKTYDELTQSLRNV